MTKLKVCGLSRDIDIDIANELIPDYVGFVFANSSRQVDEELACYLRAKLEPVVQSVGVFVNDSLERIIRLCNAGIIDLVQLHGDEDEEYIRMLKKEIHQPVIKAVRVQSKDDILKAEELSSDYILLDCYHESQYGGCGKSFDWSLITKVHKPFFLAGGINNRNVIQAINQAQPYCIDISSGVETDGWKDRIKIIEILRKIRSVG